MKDFVFVIQARSGSTRLPNKMLMHFYDELTIPQVLVRKFKVSFPDINIIFATSNSPLDNNLSELMKGEGIDVYRGDENNVLQRFIDATKNTEGKIIIRVCADNPFIDIELIKNLIENWKIGGDYLAHKVNDKPSMKVALGFFVELVNRNALMKIQDETNENIYLEHVTNYVYRENSGFKVNWISAPELIEQNDGIRLTVDTIGDFNTAKYIYKTFVERRVEPCYKEIITFVRDNPELLERMKKENSDLINKK